MWSSEDGWANSFTRILASEPSGTYGLSLHDHSLAILRGGRSVRVFDVRGHITFAGEQYSTPSASKQAAPTLAQGQGVEGEGESGQARTGTPSTSKQPAPTLAKEQRVEGKGEEPGRTQREVEEGMEKEKEEARTEAQTETEMETQPETGTETETETQQPVEQKDAHNTETQIETQTQEEEKEEGEWSEPETPPRPLARSKVSSTTTTTNKRAKGQPTTDMPKQTRLPLGKSRTSGKSAGVLPAKTAGTGNTTTDVPQQQHTGSSPTDRRGSIGSGGGSAGVMLTKTATSAAYVAACTQKCGTVLVWNRSTRQLVRALDNNNTSNIITPSNPSAVIISNNARTILALCGDSLLHSSGERSVTVRSLLPFQGSGAQLRSGWEIRSGTGPILDASFVGGGDTQVRV